LAGAGYLDPSMNNVSRRFRQKHANAAIAISASGDNVPGSSASTEPAPIKSSRHGRRELSGHRSPAGMTAIREPQARAPRATAGVLRKEAVNVGTPLADSESVLPFGDGKTRRVLGGIERSDAGDSEYAWSVPRPSATAVENDKTSTITTASLAG
jgi:hypothetical protein